MLNSAPGNLDTESADSLFITVDDSGISWDLCVICRARTPYRSSTVVEERSCYIEGSGQCCYEHYLKLKPFLSKRSKTGL